MSDVGKVMLVVSAHAADFVWRAGGTIALHSSARWRVRILCLSFGERGESQGAWAEPGMTIDRVKEIRREESRHAAAILGAEVRFLDGGDYPLRPSDQTIHEMVVEMKTLQPACILTHSRLDPYNFDHPVAHQMTLEARVYAQALGFPVEGAPLGAPPVYLFEPHQPEQCGFTPQVLLDVTAAWDRKQQAMASMKAQGHLLDYYSDLGRRRGSQAVRNGGNKGIRYAEAFERVYPQVVEALL
ncbi:MAG: PIG-L deacetylase family protein [Vicinamibacterales bacterium]